MQYEEYCYVGYKNEFTQSTKIYNINEVDSSDGEKEHYQTIYRFPESIKEHRSIRDIPEDMLAYADYLTFDIDRANLSDASIAVQKLESFCQSFDIGYELWFSGNKGFHLLIPSVQFDFQPTNNPEILRSMAVAIAEYSKVEIDTKIYNMSRIFRMPGSLHKKSGKSKLPCFFKGKELLFADGEQFPDSDDYLVNDRLLSVYKAVCKSLEKKPAVKSSGVVGQMFVPVGEGDRNSTCFKIAKQLRERKHHLEDCLTLLNLWNNNFCNPPLKEQEIKTTLRSAFKGGVEYIVQDPSMANECYDPRRSIKSIHELYHNYDKNIVKTGYDFWDQYTMGLMPGELTFWLAVNGNLKTCILSNVLNKISHNTGKHTLLFSMDMSANALQVRHIQAAEQLTYREVISKVRKKYEFPKFQEQYAKTIVIDKKSPTVDDVERLIDWWVDNRGPIGAIGFDYLGSFRGCDNDNKVTGDTVHALDALAGKVGICPIICLVQARREYEGRGGNVELDKTAGKDTSAIEHKGDYIIGSWWHETEDPDNNGQLKREYYGRFLKNRKFDSEKYPDNAYFKLNFNKEYMRLNSMEWCRQPPTFKQKMRMGR
jgi:hypothetical protein